MNVAFISFEYPPDTAFGGIATYVGEAARALASAGHHVEVFAASKRREGKFADGQVTVNLVRTGARETFAEEIESVFADRQAVVAFDVVESPEYYADGRCISTRWPKIPLVVKLHTPNELIREINPVDPNWIGWLRAHRGQLKVAIGALRRYRRPAPYRFIRPHLESHRPIETIEQDFVRKADLIVSPSQSLRSWVNERWGLPLNTIIVVPNPYTPTPGLLDIPADTDSAVVGFFGRLEERKGIATLLQAIPRVLSACPRVRFRLVGEPRANARTLEPYDAYIRRKLKPSLGSIELVGKCPREKMASEYAKADIAVFPSHWENFPNVCLEAMAAARGIVASAAGGMADMIETEWSGLLLAPRDPQAWAGGIIRLLTDRAQRIAMGIHARERFLSTYTPFHIVPRLEASFVEAIERHAHRVR